MPAPKGNEFWKARAKHGRNKKFENSEVLWAACCEYFEWVDANPLKESKIFHHAGNIVTAEVAKMRAMTIGGLCIFLDISMETWCKYRKDEGFIDITTRADAIIRTQKFEGAAADLLNANIIARDLGLRDKKEVSGPGGGPVAHQFVFIAHGADGETDKD